VVRSALVWLPLLGLLAASGCAATAAGVDDAAAPPGAEPPRADASSVPPPRDAGAPTPEAGHQANDDANVDAGAPRPCGALALCDDFEGAPMGGPPDPARWTVGAPDLTGTGTLAIDDGQRHSGARAVKVTGQGGYSNHIFFTNAAAIASLGPVVWARLWIRLAGALGDGHVTFLAMKDAHDGGKHLRLGGQSKILMWNRESDDATLPALSPTGIAASAPLPVERWTCLELMIDARGPMPPSMRTWVDGAELAGLHLDAVPTPDLDEQWLREADWRPALTDFALGWESYAGQAMTLWFDDVALDAARPGCL
jgi:hypothetical protein